jgi:hypothetical protein
MATCEVTLPLVVLEDTSNLDVVGKYRELSEAALAIDSIYMRAKDTFKELLDGSNLTKTEYANLASQFVSSLAIQTTSSAMTAAMQWATQEKELAYSLAQVKSNIAMTNANIEKIKRDICLADKEIDLKCAQVTATLATSIRDNGRIATYDANNSCIPLSLMDEGVKYDQKEVYQAQTYTALADAYRKSGIVDISTTLDGVKKGTAGDNLGYTDAQEEYARRQIKSFEDSKRNHAANAMSGMIGQMLSAEIAPSVEDITRWRTSIDYLNTNTI